MSAKRAGISEYRRVRRRVSLQFRYKFFIVSLLASDLRDFLIPVGKFRRIINGYSAGQGTVVDLINDFFNGVVGRDKFHFPKELGNINDEGKFFVDRGGEIGAESDKNWDVIRAREIFKGVPGTEVSKRGRTKGEVNGG